MNLRAFCREARGGGGRLRHAIGRMKKENVRWILAVIKAKAVAVASACLCVSGLVRSLYHTLYSMYVILTYLGFLDDFAEGRFNYIGRLCLYRKAITLIGRI